ncbi:MAG: hypothetical protein HY782_01120 [Chloroflexi bacterium]|nr:hypothetical protein [Chloroflexota bacterium]
MIKRVGNQLRESSARADQLVADNLPNLVPVEEWRALYWTMDPEGRLAEGRADLHVLQGVAAVTRPIRIGENGVIENVRRWGVMLRGGVLETIGFDPTPFLTHDHDRFPSDDAEALYLVTALTHFDLPGFFILASEEYPFLLFDPGGDLKGSYTNWYTHAGALAYHVTNGRLATSFGLTWEKDRVLYSKVMRALRELMAEKKRDIREPWHRPPGQV